ncbi:MAG TPA: PIN domain-containing protein [Rhizomicrobium sp.]|nr:PIN domain-containing protein [Rhizomicrobium sp.]
MKIGIRLSRGCPKRANESAAPFGHLCCTLGRCRRNIRGNDERSERGPKPGPSRLCFAYYCLGDRQLARKGRFKSHYSPQRWFEVLMSKPDTALAELTPRILMESWFLPGSLHHDPADRIIAATAREYGYTVITRDRALLHYADQGHLGAIEC